VTTTGHGEFTILLWSSARKSKEREWSAESLELAFSVNLTKTPNVPEEELHCT
jgi:hypothetical protein